MKLVIMMSLLGSFFSSVSFANRESGGRYSASAVYVDFRSFGAGIDYESLKTFETLSSAANARGEVVDMTAEQRGREGETLRCVELTNATHRFQFIQSLAFSILYDTQKSGQRTAVYVGINCHSFENATEQDLSKY